VVTDAALVIAVDRVNDRQRAGGFRFDPGFLKELSHRALRDGLAELENTAWKPPAAWHRRVGTTHDQDSIATQDDR
jgi:hypothetical protein